MDKRKEILLSASLLIITFFLTTCYMMTAVNPPKIKKMRPLISLAGHKFARDVRSLDFQEQGDGYPFKIHVLNLRRVWPPSIHPCPFLDDPTLTKTIPTKTTTVFDRQQQNNEIQSRHTENNGSVLLRFFDNVLKSKLEVRFGRNEVPVVAVPPAFRIKIRTGCNQKDLNAENVRIKIASIRSQVVCVREGYSNVVPTKVELNSNNTFNDFQDIGTEQNGVNLKNATLPIIKNNNNSCIKDDASNSSDIEQELQTTVMELEKMLKENNTTAILENFTTTIKEQQKTWVVNTEETVELPMFTATVIDRKDIAIDSTLTDTSDFKQIKYPANNGNLDIEEQTKTEHENLEQNDRELIRSTEGLIELEDPGMPTESPVSIPNMLDLGNLRKEENAQHVTQESPLSSKDSD